MENSIEYGVPHDPEDLAEAEMELTDFMYKLVIEHFDCELEMLQGKIEPMDDGRTRYTFKVDQQKGGKMHAFIMRVIINSQPINFN